MSHSFDRRRNNGYLQWRTDGPASVTRGTRGAAMVLCSWPPFSCTLSFNNHEKRLEPFLSTDWRCITVPAHNCMMLFEVPFKGILLERSQLGSLQQLRQEILGRDTSVSQGSLDLVSIRMQSNCHRHRVVWIAFKRTNIFHCKRLLNVVLNFGVPTSAHIRDR